MKIKLFSHPGEVFKQLANIEAEIKSHLWSDLGERNHLDFTPAPKIPEFKKVEIKPLTGGVWHMCRQFLP